MLINFSCFGYTISSKLQSCGQSLHRFSKRWLEFKILKKMTKLWLRFLKLWLPLNVINGSHIFKRRTKVWPLVWEFETHFYPFIRSKFSEKWPNFGLLFKNVALVRLPLVTFNGSRTFKKGGQNLAIFLRIWNSSQHFENRCKLWPQL